jgi:4-diphosphocytidyl-2-C-methyl-D-erythritol kinase
MFSERLTDGLVMRAPAKVNLFLEVLGKRTDGYHEIATLMVAVSLDDTLVFKEDASGAIHLLCDHPGLSTGPDNLIVRAAQLLRERTGCRRGAAIQLVKRIPLAAGLAGGSTDAAAALAGLNRLWQLDLTDAELASLGGEVGSDVPFFFATPAAWCTGRGEKVTAVPLGCPLHFVVVCPPVGLSTAEVYRRVAVPEQPLDGTAICQALRAGDPAALGKLLHNRLQSAAEKLCPLVAQTCRRLEELQPLGVLMSGSGSSLFALGRDQSDAWRIARGLRSGPEEASGQRVFIVQSCV